MVDLHPWEYNEVPVVLGSALALDVPVVALHLTRPRIEIPGREAPRLAVVGLRRQLTDGTAKGKSPRSTSTPTASSYSPSAPWPNGRGGCNVDRSSSKRHASHRRSERPVPPW